ncbi:PREDICTED: neuronal-specific septin-3-like [Amphimedon queenslandica]|uniref:Septin-type G domain-containing protein n=1 Tax=Amphimedon queenslandica TaxID=400682 RepID=A0A1X7VFM7_AMPQE|nr:PREDICTED: neuronal-specific septin-3-like [Amphimedon queenslandica]|eukprot:XP_003384519.1 PREDICTED: neuronal-specific septin-3-like [Amphimedon queenslandica]
MASGSILTQNQYDVIAKVFRQADTEETGTVDSSRIIELALAVLGQTAKDPEKQLVKYYANLRGNNPTIAFADFLEMMGEILTETTRWGNLTTRLEGYVGFDTIQEQIRKKSLKKGFEFNLIVVGESGLGKSTLVNTLFKSKISRTSCTPGPHIIPKTTEVNSVSHVIEEQNVRLKLTITDTPGFGDQINNDKCWAPILEYVNDQFAQYLHEEVNIVRKRIIPDTRVHCCLYFIPPTGHCLRPIDIEFMKRLDEFVNIVPVIAKSDTLTIEERDAFKARIREDLTFHNIRIYPSGYNYDDEEESAINNKIEQFIPFAVIGSDKEMSVGGKRVLGRQTKWGFVEVENKKHCEFAQVRDMLIKTHMQDLKETTDKVHYENYRQRRLRESKAAPMGESNI